MSTYVVAHLPTQPTTVHALVLSVHRSYVEATAWIDGRLTLDPLRADPPAVWEWVGNEWAPCRHYNGVEHTFADRLLFLERLLGADTDERRAFRQLMIDAAMRHT